MINGKVISVKLIEHISRDLDLCEIEIEFDILKIFGSYNEIMTYIGKRVQYSVRKDMYKGQQINVIANLAEMYTIQTVAEEDNIKLLPDDSEHRSVCNFSIDTIKYGDYDVGCIAFLSGYEVGSSKKTKWIDCKMVDKKSKQFDLRIFTRQVEDGVDAEETISGLVGSYVKFDINNTRYGYQTNEIELYNVPVVVPPEVEIAIVQILKAISQDEELCKYIEQYDFINTLKNIIDGELGYNLVSIASEIYLIKAICNISNEYNMKTLIRAAITSRGYLLPTKTKFSRPLLNTNKVLKSALARDRDLILLLDIFSEEEASPTKKAFVRIGNFARDILNERRGISDEESNSVVNIDTFRNKLGGLL